MYRRESLGRKWRRRLFKVGKWLGITVLAALVAGYGYMRYDFLTRADRLEEELATARSFGLPLDPESIDRFHSVPLDQNAAPRYAAIAPKVQAIQDDKNAFVEPDFHLIFADESCRSALAPMLDRIRPINAELREAAALPDMAMQKKWEDTWQVLFPEYAEMKCGSKWLAAEALDAARSGNWDLANKNLEAIGRLSYHAGRDHVFIGGLVQVAIGSIGLRAAEKLAEVADRQPGELARLRTTVARYPESPPFERYLKGEAFSAYWTMSKLSDNLEMMASNFDSHGGPSLIDKWMIMPPLIESELVENANAAETLHYWNEIFRMIREDKVPATKLGAKMDRLVMELDGDLKPWMKWSTIMFPVFAQGGVALARHDANKACTLALIDALQFKAKNGRWPKSLQETSSKLVDPYGDGKLRMLVKEGSIRIYSIGPDLKDEGGLTRQEFSLANRQGSHDDQVVGYPDASMSVNFNLQEAMKRLFEQIARSKQKASTAAMKVVSPPVGRLIQ